MDFSFGILQFAIAGVLLAMTIPHRKKEDFSLLIKIEHAISPYVAFGIMPLFAFANAGVSLGSFASLLDKVPLGIVLGLFLGKQLGVFIFSYISIKFKIAQMPNDTSLVQFLWCRSSHSNEFVCWKFGICYTIYGWCKNRSTNWVVIIHFIWLFFDILTPNKPNI